MVHGITVEEALDVAVELTSTEGLTLLASLMLKICFVFMSNRCVGQEHLV